MTKRLNLKMSPDVYDALRELISNWDDIDNMSDAVRRCIVDARDRQAGLREYRRIIAPLEDDDVRLVDGRLVDARISRLHAKGMRKVTTYDEHTDGTDDASDRTLEAWSKVIQGGNKVVTNRPGDG